MRDAFIDFDYSQESNNYCPEDFDPNENVINKFKKSTKKVDDFKNTLVIPQGLENEDSFYYAFLYAIRFRLKNRKDECCDDKLKKYIGVVIIFHPVKFISTDQPLPSIICRRNISWAFQNFHFCSVVLHNIRLRQAFGKLKTSSPGEGIFKGTFIVRELILFRGGHNAGAQQ